MRGKNVFCALAMVASAMIVLFGLVTSVSAAGDWPYNQDNQLGGSMSGNGSYYSSTASNGENYANAWFSLNLDPQKFSFNSAYWSFYTSPYDPSRWFASCYLNGFRDDSESWPQSQYWSQSINGLNGLNISESLSLSCQQYKWQESPELSLSGSFNIQAGLIDSSHFNFSEYEEQYWTNWPDDYVMIPAWRATYQLDGHFVATTLAEAQAMGAPYVQGVPEPSTLGLLGTGLLAIAGWLWRRKRQ